MIPLLFFVFISGVVLTHSYEPYHVPLGSSIWGYFNPPVLKRPQQFQTPLEAMVDLTNRLGISILQDHSYSRGNFAFSPYGVASVLVVLYEGARGESANQIYQTVGFPSNKDVLRMGFRDIHRHLRSYFSHEGFLSGITLNKNSSNLKPEYKKILKYYGYDVDLNLNFHDESKDEQDAKPSTQGAQFTKTTATTTPLPTSSSSTTTESINIEMDLKNETAVKKPEESTNTAKGSTEDGNELSTTALPTTAKEALPITGKEIVEDGNGLSTTALPTTALPTTVLPTTAKEALLTTGEEIAEGGNESITTTLPTTIEETSSPTGKEIGAGENELSTTISATTIQEISPTAEEVNTGDDSKLDASTTVTLNEDEVLTTTESKSADDSSTDQTMTSEPTTESNPEEPTTTETESGSKRTEPSAVYLEDVVRPEILEPDDNKENKFQKTLEFDEQNVKCKNEVGTNMRNMGTPCEEERKGKTEDEPVTKVPEGSTESEGIKLDNGMLIPQPSEEQTNLEGPRPSNFLEFTTGAIDLNKQVEEISSEEVPGRKFLRAVDGTTRRRVLRLNNEAWQKNFRKLFDSKTKIWEYEPRKKRKGARAGRYKRTIADYLKWPLNPDLSLQLQNGMYDTHVSRNAEMYRGLPRRMFLVDGAIDTPVPMMTYTNVFPYGYIPRLHAKALEFPLDDIRYKLLIVLPIERRGLRQLIYDLADFSVRDVLKCLRPTRVEAMIPSFMVEGFVILTSSLQKLGIWDVFDPRKANLSGMSVDPELYVRNIEQSVTVVIRNYVEILDIQTRTMAARYLEHKFEATHPFVYFVLDTATNIALMAGQMLDPLNSRIY